MSEFVERVKPEEIVLDEGVGESGDEPFAPLKLFGVAVAGAVTALAAYYAWVQMEPEKRAALTESLMSAARSQVRHWGEETLAED